MAIDSLGITNLADLAGTEQGKMKLAEELVGIIKNVERKTLSSIFKNRMLSGDPSAGTLTARRYAAAQSKAYGTARTAGKGDKGKALTVSVDINIDREIFEEYEEKDIKLNGIPGLLAERKAAIESAMIRELDEKFFAVAVAADGGTELVATASTVKDRLTALILALHTTKNSFVDGVEKDDIHVTLSADAYEAIRDYIDTKPNANVQTDAEDFGKYHGVWVYSNNHQPEGIQMIAQCFQSIAQPVMPSEYRAEKIQFSDAYNVGLPYYYGCRAVMPDLIRYVKNPTTGA